MMYNRLVEGQEWRTYLWLMKRRDVGCGPPQGQRWSWQAILGRCSTTTGGSASDAEVAWFWNVGAPFALLAQEVGVSQIHFLAGALARRPPTRIAWSIYWEDWFGEAAVVAGRCLETVMVWWRGGGGEEGES